VGFSDYLVLSAAHKNEVLSAFPAGEGFRRAFESSGPVPEIYGEAVSAVGVVDAGGSTSIETHAIVANYDPNGPFDPVAVQAVIGVDTGPPPQFFAVAVNGVVRATISAYSFDGNTSSIYAIVPPGSFVRGDNEIEVFGIAKSGAEISLVRFG
jgi:hypothetical protein